MTAGKIALFVRDSLAEHYFGKLTVRFEQQKSLFRAAAEIKKRQRIGFIGGQIGESAWAILDLSGAKTRTTASIPR